MIEKLNTLLGGGIILGLSGYSHVFMDDGLRSNNMVATIPANGINGRFVHNVHAVFSRPKHY